MSQPHLMEFWSHMAEHKPTGINALTLDQIMVLGKDSERHSLRTLIPKGITTEIQDDVEATWKEAITTNPKMTNGHTLTIHQLSPWGTQVRLKHSDYKTSHWLKTKLSDQPFELQMQLANQFAVLNIGVVTATSDDRIMLGQRPEGVTAPLMFLNYPCGYVERHHRTLAETLDSEAKDELGFPVYDSSNLGELHQNVRNVHAIGVQRESGEWTPNYTFMMRLNLRADEIKPTREVPTIKTLPLNPLELIEEMVGLYHPTVKGDEAKGKLVPNATGMLALYVRQVGGVSMFDELMDRLAVKAKDKGYKLTVENYTTENDPFS